MKMSELKELSAEELAQRFEGFKKMLFDLRMQRAGGKLTKPHEIRQARRDAARISTLLGQRKSKGQEG